jgi:hypothetical protein
MKMKPLVSDLMFNEKSVIYETLNASQADNRRRSARLALKSKRKDVNDSLANGAVYFHRWTIYLQE